MDHVGVSGFDAIPVPSASVLRYNQERAWFQIKLVVSSRRPSEPHDGGRNTASDGDGLVVEFVVHLCANAATGLMSAHFGLAVDFMLQALGNW